jgi:hypothetical protein
MQALLFHLTKPLRKNIQIIMAGDLAVLNHFVVAGMVIVKLLWLLIIKAIILPVVLLDCLVVKLEQRFLCEAKLKAEDFTSLLVFTVNSKAYLLEIGLNITLLRNFFFSQDLVVSSPRYNFSS